MTMTFMEASRAAAAMTALCGALMLLGAQAGTTPAPPPPASPSSYGGIGDASDTDDGGGDHARCSDAVTTTLGLSWLSVPLSSLVASSLMLVTLLVLLARLSINYRHSLQLLSAPSRSMRTFVSSRDSSASTFDRLTDKSLVLLGDADGDDSQDAVHSALVAPVYYFFGQALVLLFVVQGAWMLVPDSPGKHDFGRVLWCLHAATDNFPVAFCFQRDASWRSLRRAFAAVGVLVGIRVVLLLLWGGERREPCPWCSVFLPIPAALAMDAGLAVAYFLVLCSYASTCCRRIRPRKAMSTWVGYLFIGYFAITVGAQLARTGHDVGNCVVLASILYYCFGYAMVLYRLFTDDSPYLIAKSAAAAARRRAARQPDMTTALLGDAGSESGSTAMLRDSPEVQSALLAARRAGVATIAWRDVAMGRKIGAGGFGEVYRASWRRTDVAVKRLFASGDLLAWHNAAGGGTATAVRVDDAADSGSGIALRDSALSDAAGSSGKVRVAEATGSAAAAGGAASSTDLLAELRLHQRLRHPNVCLLLGLTAAPDGSLCIVQEFCANGSLVDLIHRRRETLRHHVSSADAAGTVLLANGEERVMTATCVLDMLRDAARGMAYLHGCAPPVMHRDLKGGNLLVDDQLRVKCGDFGLSKEMATSRATTRIGSVQWTAPEVLVGDPYEKSADVWSFGVCVWELLTRRLPFAKLSQIAVATQVAMSGARLSMPRSLPQPLEALIRDCWSAAGERPSFEDILRRLDAMRDDLAVEPWDWAWPLPCSEEIVLPEAAKEGAAGGAGVATDSAATAAVDGDASAGAPPPAAGSFSVGSGWSVAADADTAVDEAVRAACERIGCEAADLDLLLLWATDHHQPLALRSALAGVAAHTRVHAWSSFLGTLTDEGYHVAEGGAGPPPSPFGPSSPSLSLFAVNDDAGTYGVGCCTGVDGLRSLRSDGDGVSDDTDACVRRAATIAVRRAVVNAGARSTTSPPWRVAIVNAPQTWEEHALAGVSEALSASDFDDVVIMGGTPGASVFFGAQDTGMAAEIESRGAFSFVMHPKDTAASPDATTPTGDGSSAFYGAEAVLSPTSRDVRASTLAQLEVSVSLLAPSVRASVCFGSGHTPTAHSGVITRASGHRIETIDGEPAVEVYNRWCGGALTDFIAARRAEDEAAEAVDDDAAGDVAGGDAAGGAVGVVAIDSDVRDFGVLSGVTMLHPLGLPLGTDDDETPVYLTVVPIGIARGGAIVTASMVQQGTEVTLHAGTKPTVAARLARLVRAAAREAGADAPDDVAGAFMVLCGGFTTLEGMEREVTARFARVIGPQPLCAGFSFAEQGMLQAGGLRTGNCMLSALVFSRVPALVE